jgi:hypothetical protein
MNYTTNERETPVVAGGQGRSAADVTDAGVGLALSFVYIPLAAFVLTGLIAWLT